MVGSIEHSNVALSVTVHSASWSQLTKKQRTVSLCLSTASQRAVSLCQTNSLAVLSRQSRCVLSTAHIKIYIRQQALRQQRACLLLHIKKRTTARLCRALTRTVWQVTTQGQCVIQALRRQSVCPVCNLQSKCNWIAAKASDQPTHN